MKIQPVQLTTYNCNMTAQKTQNNKNCGNFEFAKTLQNLNNIPHIHPVTFLGIQNSSKLRVLFSYKLPCMYSGITMIDPKVLNRWIKSRLFFKKSSEVIKTLQPYEESLTGVELKIYTILKERSKIHPDWTIKQILEELKPVYCRQLRKQQAPIFHELSEIFKTLPEEYNSKFKFLMENTEKKLNERPVLIPFSSYEFKYRLEKIAADIANTPNIKEKKVMRKLLKESKRFSNTTNAKTLDHQKEVLEFLKLILRKSVLKRNERLNDLMTAAQARLNKDEIIVSFSRKAFIYDLLKIIEDLPDKNLQGLIFKTASKLPTSNESTSAYFMKLLSESPEKIGHRLIWPSLASVEHILPRSCGGADIMANFGGATTRENSNRKNIEFVKQMQRKPETPQNCQKYVNRLIELYKQGIFYKIGLSPKYIRDFKNTIYEQSKHLINLDISQLY